MNRAQRQNLINSIAAILAIDFDEHYLSQIPSDSNLLDYKFGEWDISKFKELLFKAIRQLKSELDSPNWEFLPNAENFQSDIAPFNLEINLQDLNSHLRLLSSRDAATAVLKKIIYYEIRFGFWDRSAVKKHDVNEEAVTALYSKLEIIEKNLNRNLENFNELHAEYNSSLDRLKGQLDESAKNLGTSHNLLKSATAHERQINEILHDSRNINTEINGLETNIRDKIEIVTKDIQVYKDELTSMKNDQLSLGQELVKASASAKSDMETALAMKSWIEDQKEKIERLVGMAADGSLGSRFEKRENQLDTDILFWRNAIPIATAAAVAWVVAVFFYFQVHTSNVWVDLLINLLKTSPAFVLLGFVFNQYSKERNLKEEYAFKSAISMTLTAYSSMLEQRDHEENKSRQQMLLKSIDKVYNQPKIHNEKNDAIFSFKTKDLKDVVKDLTGTVKEVKNSLNNIEGKKKQTSKKPKKKKENEDNEGEQQDDED